MAKDYRAARIKRGLARAQKAHERAAKSAPQISNGNSDKQPDNTPLIPLNAKQKSYLKALNKDDQIITLGLAGTGKTYIPSAWASDQLRDKKVERIVLSRPAVSVEEEHGFLPGNMGEKIAPWVRPFTDVMEKRLGTANFKKAMASKAIEVVPIAYMRGLTFDNAIVILDEAQNCTYKQLKMFLTRIGKNSKVIINGDIKQTDLTQESGLAIIIKMIKEQDIPVDIIEFTKEDIVRSGICALWADAFEKYEDANPQ